MTLSICDEVVGKNAFGPSDVEEIEETSGDWAARMAAPQPLPTQGPTRWGSFDRALSGVKGWLVRSGPRHCLEYRRSAWSEELKDRERWPPTYLQWPPSH